MTTQTDIRQQRQARAARLVARVREVVPDVLRRYPVIAAYVYGSAARGTMLETSDLDIALVLAQTLPPYDRLQLELKIQADVEDALGFMPVDVRAIDEAPLMVRGTVVQTGLRVYEGDHDRRVAFEVATRMRYFDYAPSARRLQQAFLDHVHKEGILGHRS
jgi:predicted nucleotidyltransferase